MAGDHQRQPNIAEDPAADDGTVTRIAKQLHYYAGDGRNAFLPEWGSFEIKSDESVEIAIINGLNICNKLKVSGNVNTSELKGDVKYEVVFVVMLKNYATTWDVPMKFHVKLPDGIGMPAKQERTENLVSKPKQQWMEILAGEFKTIPNMKPGSIINFSLHIESVQVQESGLVIKSVIFRRVSTPLNPTAIQPWEINARELSIYRGQLKDHWTWDVIQEDPINSCNNTYYEVVQLADIVWFEVIGKYDASKLTKGLTYEVVFFVRLNNEAQGWEDNQVTPRINGEDHSPVIIDKSTYQTKDFKELTVGCIKVDQQTMTDGIEFSLTETSSGVSKKGLVIKNVLLSQK